VVHPWKTPVVMVVDPDAIEAAGVSEAIGIAKVPMYAGWNSNSKANPPAG